MSPPAAGARGGKVRVAKRKTDSSRRWLERQLSDPYVREARRHGYRSRAAFKLRQLDDRFKVLGAGRRVLDLGAAPGGWTQVAVERVGRAGRVVGVDLQDIDPIEGATILKLDATDASAEPLLRDALGGAADVILSDMAAPATGHPGIDHLRVMALCEAAFDLARTMLAPGGTFVAKVLRGGTERALLTALKRDFATVRHAKPAASRADSREMYVVAQGFRGPPSEGNGDAG